MKKLFFILCLLILSTNYGFAYKHKNYYIEKDKDYELEWLCFSKKNCYNATPVVINVKDKNFVGFGGYHYYDINSYKHNIVKDIYNVDIAVDRDPSTDNGYYTKCPFDEGLITHLIFSLTYIPQKKIFEAKYKGFISSKEIVEYEKGIPTKMYLKYLNIYYNNEKKYIEELDDLLDYFNKRIIKTFGKQHSQTYDIEIIYILKHYIFSKL